MATDDVLKSLADRPRYRLTVEAGGRPVTEGWWHDGPVAEKKYAEWVGLYSDLDGARIVLADMGDGERVLKRWP